MIKKVLFSVLVAVTVTSCNNQQTTASNIATNKVDTIVSENDSVGLGVIEFTESTYDFGTIKEGEIVEHVFQFKNTGNAPVILAQVAASCGCTTPNYSKEPILPGKEGQVFVSYDSKGQVGTQQKIITVSSNAENRVTTVQIKGIVE